MTFPIALTSLFAAVRRTFASRHTWAYDHRISMRTCEVCGRKEELCVELVSTEWGLVEAGDPAAHIAIPDNPKPSTPQGLTLARNDSPSQEGISTTAA